MATLPRLLWVMGHLAFSRVAHSVDQYGFTTKNTHTPPSTHTSRDKIVALTRAAQIGRLLEFTILISRSLLLTHELTA